MMTYSKQAPSKKTHGLDGAGVVLRVGNVGNESTAPQYLEVDSGCLGGSLGEAFLPRLCLMVDCFPL